MHRCEYLRGCRAAVLSSDNAAVPGSRPAFYANVRRLQEVADRFDVLLPAHAELPARSYPRDLIAELVEGIALILDGTLVGQPERTAIGEGLRSEFGSTGVTYRSDRL